MEIKHEKLPLCRPFLGRKSEGERILKEARGEGSAVQE